MPHEFELEYEIEVDATPEAVWDAIATGHGLDSWFMGRNEIEATVGGAARTILPGFAFEATVTASDPPKRLAQRTAEGPDGSVHAFEFLIEGREGGSTVVRWVHSGFLGDDWEAEYEGLSEGDPMYLDKLGQYLRYFRGWHATPVGAWGPKVKERDRAWELFGRGLGLPGPVEVGERVRLTPARLEPIDGVVDYRTPSFLGVRASDAIYRFIYGYDGTIVLGHHLFREGADQQKEEAAWSAWLGEVFG
jgi:uncharacterized protein YndB with AHSA1/START domain